MQLSHQWQKKVYLDPLPSHPEGAALRIVLWGILLPDGAVSVPHADLPDADEQGDEKGEGVRRPGLHHVQYIPVSVRSDRRWF